MRLTPRRTAMATALALLVRFLAQHPELAVVPKVPTASEVFSLMNEATDVELKRFATYFGAEASASYRWMRPDARPASVVVRLMHFMKTALLMRDTAGRTHLLEGWRQTVASEASSRGVPDVFQSGRWSVVPLVDKGAPSSQLPPATTPP